MKHVGTLTEAEWLDVKLEILNTKATELAHRRKLLLASRREMVREPDGPAAFHFFERFGAGDKPSKWWAG